MIKLILMIVGMIAITYKLWNKEYKPKYKIRKYR